MRYPWTAEGVARRIHIDVLRLRCILNGSKLPNPKEAARIAALLEIRVETIAVQKRRPGRPRKIQRAP